MLVEKIIEHVDLDQIPAGLQVDKVFVANEDLAKRLHHLTSEGAQAVAVHLPDGQHLHVGDVLYQDADKAIVVDVLPEDVLIIKPGSIQAMGKIAHALGNRHLPAQFSGDTMIVQYDYLVEKLLQDQQINFEHKALKLPQPFLHVGHHHDA
ncbi:hypothetical protein FC83_GL001710 [Agrilactobacillus composti DSM 18527 = JCM 14202]|uniref:Urease accessory protein UreE n=1 Tax=Agrilactobacillus composti DSM 18527 = JCM 14202 TaxID=1423734 RepID=X0PLP2_9LACO|nr:urease accessory protein UreE [Agrilactobacillus composti]KRM30575.1 hypothetical protein FC83_GL001710 [Agrilactobacillus composti DSM 18527 = JCM 14202]GAF38352.1 urease accessory protein UreE [Agrilactobacillus composti DSM 18527 = JCM 14202]